VSNGGGDPREIPSFRCLATSRETENRTTSAGTFYHGSYRGTPILIPALTPRPDRSTPDEWKTNGGSEWGRTHRWQENLPPAGFEDHRVCSDALWKPCTLLDSSSVYPESVL